MVGFSRRSGVGQAKSKTLAQCVGVIATLGFIFFAAPHSFGSDFQSPRTAALGGAGHAGPLLNDSIYLDPSYVAFLPAMGVSANYGWSNYQDSSYKYKVQNVSIQDGNPTDFFQAGFGFSHLDEGNLFSLGTGKQIIAKRLSVGLGGKAFFPVTAPGANPDHFFDMNFSATYIFSDWIQAAVLADNLINGSLEQVYGFERQVTLGTKFNYEKIVILYVDPHLFTDLPSGKFGYEAGVEFPTFVDFFLRAGIFHNATIPTEANETLGNGFGFGFGWIGPKMSVDYGLSRSLFPMIGTAQVIGLTAYL